MKMHELLQTRSWFHYFLRILAIAGLYFLLARVSLLFQFENSNATPVWPPAGFAFAMILLFGKRIAPGIFFGAFAANFFIFISNQMVDYPLAAWLSLFIGLGNMGEALVGNYLYKKTLGDYQPNHFPEKISHISLFTIVAAIMTTVSSTVGTATDYFAGLIPESQIGIVWLTWWMGDLAGILLVTLLILIWIKTIKEKEDPATKPVRSANEAIVFFLLVVLSGGIVFNNWFYPLSLFRWAYWVIPMLVWAALRFSQAELITAIGIYAVMATWGTVHYLGPFGSAPLNEALLVVQGFIAIMVVTKLILQISVTDQKRIEQKLRSSGMNLEETVKKRTGELREQKLFAEMLIENSPYMILAYNKNFEITAWNKKSEEHSGLTKDKVLGRKMLEVFPQFEDSPQLNEMNTVLETGQAIHYPKYPFYLKSGWGETFVTPLLNSHNQVVGLLSITRDITDMVNMTSTLEQKNKDLLKTIEELSSFAYVASHDLKEPLRKIQIFANRIVDDDHNILTDQSKDFFSRMNSAAQRMQSLIEDLLTYSRTGGLIRNFEKIHLKDIVEEVRESLKDEINLRNAVINTEDLCECHAIPFQIRQLFHNLISNSLKFSKKEIAPRITIRSKIDQGKNLPNPALDPVREYCHISFADNGIGFDPAFNEQIFGLFQRLHGKHEYPGTGIGLAICKKIVDNHDGLITADGVENQGARFDIYIPHPS
jgi:PAS domain S-box-containing protein